MMAFIEVNGVQLAFERHGHGAVPLLFVHGYSGRASVYRRLYDYLAADFTVYALDLRSHGASNAVTVDLHDRAVGE